MSILHLLRVERARITLNLEPDSGAEHHMLSQDINLKMDRIEFLPQGTLPEGYKKFVDERWA